MSHIKGLFSQLDAIEKKINDVCKNQKVAPDNLEDYLHRFDWNEKSTLLSLVVSKVMVLEEIYAIQNNREIEIKDNVIYGIFKIT